MKALEQRLARLESSTEAQDRPQAAVIIYDAQTGQELTPRPKHPTALVFLPDNGRGDRCD